MLVSLLWLTPPKPVSIPAYEQISYVLKLGPVTAGRGYLSLRPDTLMGRPLSRATFQVAAGVPFYRVKDRYESWFEPNTFTSLRYTRNIHQGRYENSKIFDFSRPGQFRENDDPWQPTVDEPIDEASFLYLIRKLDFDNGPLSINRYFRPDRNPVTLTLIKRDTINTVLGRLPVIVLRPQIKTKGMFAESSNAVIWLTDDNRRLLVKVESHMPFGRVVMVMTKYLAGQEPLN